MAKKRRTRKELRIRDELRAPREHKQLFVKWLSSHPEYAKKRPTVDEVVREMRHGCLKPLVTQSVREAAQKHWREQAQYWLRHVVVVEIDIELGTEVANPVQKYIPIDSISVEPNDEHRYRTAEEVKNTPLYAQSVLHRARSDIANAIERYVTFAEFLEVFAPLLTEFKRIERKIDRLNNDSKGGAA